VRSSQQQQQHRGRGSIASCQLAKNSLARSTSTTHLPTTHSPHTTGATSISYEAILDKFRAIEAPIDKYLTLRDLLRLAPKTYYDLLLKHTEEILPFIYTVRDAGADALCPVMVLVVSWECSSESGDGVALRSL
jgi:hypothetical protein